jgi:hypothetical protein
MEAKTTLVVGILVEKFDMSFVRIIASNTILNPQKRKIN